MTLYEFNRLTKNQKRI